mgnify:CR=1 FL=1
MKEYAKRRVPTDAEDFAYRQDERGRLTRKIYQYLPSRERRVLSETYKSVIHFDREIDNQRLPDETYSLICQHLAGSEQQFEGRERIDSLLEAINNLGRERILELVREQFCNSAENVKRRYKVLEESRVRDLQEGEYPIGCIELELMFPEISSILLEKISRKYILAAKVADDVMDFQEDVKRGFLYVPRERLDQAQGIEESDNHYKIISEPYLNIDYVKEELAFSQRLFHKGKKLATPIAGAEFEIYNQTWHSFLDEAREDL